MLKIFRHKIVAKFIFWALVILILPAFVLWGTGSLSRSGPSFVGKIGGQKVTFDDFLTALTGVRAQIVLNYFDNQKMLESLLKNKSFIGRLAWDRLILIHEARKNKIKIPDSEVVNYIKNTNPIFRRNGEFDEMVYEYILRNNLGLDPRTFEEIVRQNLAMQRLNDDVAKDVTVSDEEVIENYKKDNARFKISYIYFSGIDFSDKAKVDEKTAREYYDLHKDEMVIPAKDESGNEVMRAAGYDDSREDIVKFLSEVEGTKIAEDVAKEKDAKLRELLSQSVSFEEAASRLNLKTPVETAFFSRSDYLEGIGEADRIAAAAAGMKKGDVSGPVVMRRGTVIFKLIDVEPYDVVKFEENKEGIKGKALSDKKTKILEDWLRRLESETTLNINLDEYQKYYH